MMGLSTGKLVAVLAAALFILGLVAERDRWMHRAHGAEAELAAICSATRLATDNPKLDCRQVARQVGLMGQSIANLKASAARQNEAVDALKAEGDRQSAAAAEASQKAAGRAQAAQATSTRLEASSRAGEAQAKPCEPSRALKEAWK